MQFRPLLWPTLFALPALLVLLWLGTWQVQRLEWKNQLIEDFESRATAAPVDLPSGDVGPEMEFRRLALTGSYDHDREVFMTGRTYEGNAGFHIVTPFSLRDGRIVLVNRGWVSESYRDPAKRPFTLVEGETELDAILRFPGKKGYFVPENEAENGFWFTLVPAQIVAISTLVTFARSVSTPDETGPSSASLKMLAACGRLSAQPSFAACIMCLVEH